MLQRFCVFEQKEKFMITQNLPSNHVTSDVDIKPTFMAKSQQVPITFIKVIKCHAAVCDYRIYRITVKNDFLATFQLFSLNL